MKSLFMSLSSGVGRSVTQRWQSLGWDVILCASRCNLTPSFAIKAAHLFSSVPCEVEGGPDVVLVHLNSFQNCQPAIWQDRLASSLRPRIIKGRSPRISVWMDASACQSPSQDARTNLAGQLQFANYILLMGRKAH